MADLMLFNEPVPITIPNQYGTVIYRTFKNGQYCHYRICIIKQSIPEYNNNFGMVFEYIVSLILITPVGGTQIVKTTFNDIDIKNGVDKLIRCIEERLIFGILWDN